MLELIFIFVLGICVGSFLNVLADRLPRDESVFNSRSRCEFCQHTLAWYDLFPLLSFILLRGKCRYCHKKLGWWYVLAELGTGALYVATYIFVSQHGGLLHSLNLLSLVYDLFIISALIAIFICDMKYGIIPDKIVFPAIIGSFIYLFLTPYNFLQSNVLIPHLLSALAAFAFFFFLFLITKGRGMGFGDVKLVFLLGLFLGFPQIVLSLYIAFLTGALIASILIIGKQKKLRGTTIPFGPFLVFGTIICFFYGQSLWQQVISRFF